MGQKKNIHEITRILTMVREGEQGAVDRLFPMVFDELHGIAAKVFSVNNAGDQTIQPTMLVHDVFMKLVQKTDIQWANRCHFFAIAARATRELLIDHLRKRQALKRGAGWERITLSNVQVLPANKHPIELLELEEAMLRLRELSPRQEKIVELRFFAGMTVEEIAQVLDVSARTVQYDWRMARAWLRSELGDGNDE